MNSEISILVVDDESMMRSLLKSILLREGYQVALAEDGHQALEMLEAGEFDLVLSDIKMPKMDGFELLKAVKSRDPHIGMIMMTGFGNSFTVKDALILGADEYITKPFKAHEIALVVERTRWRMENRVNNLHNANNS
ncbi:MAG: response regulator [candidate division Zixibacteria bacterium]|nr:response regulator [candidate division Zixibacteria bacterium]